MDDGAITKLIDEVRRFVKRLPVVDVVRDDIISNTCLLISEQEIKIESMACDQALRWVRGATFLVARSTERAEFRRTATWRRLQDVYRHDEVGRVFRDEARENQIMLFSAMFDALSPSDGDLLIGQVWDGYTIRELAEQRGLSAAAVEKRLSRARKACRNVINQESCKQFRT